MNAPALMLTPKRAALLAGMDNQLDVLVRFQAPAAPECAAPRPPLSLAIVIDRSGSMGGRPLAEAVRCARFIVNAVAPTDRVALIAYDDQVTVLSPALAAGDRTRLHLALDAIESGGTTALHAGWLAGASQLAPHADAAVLSRVLLLSDGQANHGLADPAAIAAQAAELASASVSTSTYGLGRSFNEELMAALARAGQGNAYYGETAQDLMEPFQTEFDLLASLCARRVKLKLSPARDVSFEVRNRLDPIPNGCRLPDLAFGSEAWALLRLKIPPAALARTDVNGNVTLLQASASFVDGAAEPGETPKAWLSLPLLPAQTYEAVAADELVSRRVEEVRIARLQDRARIAARAGDWDGVDALLRDARDSAVSNPWAGEVVRAIEKIAAERDYDRFSKAALYAADNMSRRLADPGEMLNDSSGVAESAKAAFLRRKRQQGKAEFDGNPPPA